MDKLLKQLANEASGPKFASLRNSCQDGIEFLAKEEGSRAPAYLVREKCLEPFQIALETRTKKLTVLAIKGIELILKDKQFQSSIESESEDYWLPIQILNTVYSTPNLPEDAQVEIMKILLNMTFSTACCMNSKVITRISQLCMDCYMAAGSAESRDVFSSVFLSALTVCCENHLGSDRAGFLNCVLLQVCINIYTASAHSVQMAVKATITQMLSSFTRKLRDVEDHVEEDCKDMLSEFRQTGRQNVSKEVVLSEVISILRFLTSKLGDAQKNQSNSLKQSVPVLLEGVLTILSNSTDLLGLNSDFMELLWKHLCPTLISLLGTPKSERSLLQQRSITQEELGRGSGCSTSGPNLAITTTKIIYNIAVELVRLVGGVGSLRPVLESLFHRMLLYPPPLHRHDALKAIKELFSFPENIANLASPPSLEGINSQKPPKANSDVALIKLIIDGIQECCHCNDSAVCITSVTCITLLLKTIEQLSNGIGLSEKAVREINKQYFDLETGQGTRSQKVPSTMPCDDNSEGQQCTSQLDEDQFSEGPNSYQSGGATAVTLMGKSVVSCDVDRKSSSDSSCDNITDTESSGSGLGQIRRLGQAGKQIGENLDEVEETTEDEAVIKEISAHLVYGEPFRAFPSSKCEAAERANARSFIEGLCELLPDLLRLSTITDVDDTLHQFASDFCTELSKEMLSVEENQPIVILNADGIYAASIAALALNLKLKKCNYYNPDVDGDPVISEEKFLDEVLNNGLLVFVSPMWLKEVHKQIISKDLLETVLTEQAPDTALINMITDLDGLESHELGGQMLCETWLKELNPAEKGTTRNVNSLEAGSKFARRILSTCWEGVLDVLSVLLNGKSSCGITSSLALMVGTEGAKEESLRAREVICDSLNGLQMAAKLCCKLGLQSRCGAVFAQLASTSCVMEDMKRVSLPDRKSLKPPIISNRPKLARLHAAHVLSMDVVMTIGLEMGSHSSDCWKHIFRCCTHISRLEHIYFSAGNNQSSIPKVHQETPVSLPAMSVDNCDPDLYMPPTLPLIPVAPQISVQEMIRQSSIESGWESSVSGGGVLSAAQSSKALCGLSQEVDKLFEDAAKNLNLQALVSFVSELCVASHQQLQIISQTPDDEDAVNEHSKLPTNALLLFHLQEVLMKILHTERPLLHLIQAWNAVSSHLVEAAGHRDRRISKMAVICIHDYITMVLTNYLEKPHFHVNELLCKTFENIFTLDMCDGDAQDQVVCSICELVEACTAEIRSGWRPLFAALQAVKIEYTLNEEINVARQRHTAAVLDVFEVFLSTDNVLVFSNAAVDCILCLLKYVRGPGEFESISDDDTDSGGDPMTSDGMENLCLPALKYLKECCTMLGTMWLMPACPIFNGAHRIQIGSALRTVDHNISNVNFELFRQYFNPSHSIRPSQKGEDSRFHGATFIAAEKSKEELHPRVCHQEGQSMTFRDSGFDVPGLESAMSAADISCFQLKNSRNSYGKIPKCKYNLKPLEALDNHSGLLHVWFLVLDGLANAISVCPRTYQPQTMEMLFDLLRATTNVPGPDFSLYCVNHLLLPTLQLWLRQSTRIHGCWDIGTANFKQFCGLCTDIVVEFINHFTVEIEDKQPLEVLLHHLLLVLIECVSQPTEAISRLGCSCIRHVLLTAGPVFTENMWQVAAEAFQKALDITMYNTKQLMTLFHANSENFYGDIGQVKVATRRDCSSMDFERLYQLAQQVFLLDSQMNNEFQDVDTEKSYVFLLYPPNHENSQNLEHIVTRVPFRNVVVGLLSHQLLLQTLGCILLQYQDNSSCSQSPSLVDEVDANGETFLPGPTQMPGMLSHLSVRNVIKFLECLHGSYEMACDFDARPGLKFLIQKVAQTSVASNLYKQAGASMVFYIHTLIEICARIEVTDTEATRQLLKQMSSSKLNSRESCFAKSSSFPADVKSSPQIFLFLLQNVCDELCQTYVDMLLDKESTTCVDRFSDQPLVFLIAEADDFCDITNVKKSEATEKKDNKDSCPLSLNPQQLEGQLEGEGSEMWELSLACEDNSLSDGEMKSKKERRAERESKVYTVATDKLIKNLMTEYKRRKQQHSMPAFVKVERQKTVPNDMDNLARREPVDKEIEQQQKSSIMKDSAAHVKSWTELLCTILRLFQELSDNQFLALLPTVFNCVNQLICHTEDQRLKDSLAQWLHRVGHMMGITPL